MTGCSPTGISSDRALAERMISQGFDPKKPPRLDIFHDGMASSDGKGDYVPVEEYEVLLAISGLKTEAL